MTDDRFDQFWAAWKPVRSGLSDDKKKAEEKYWKARKDTPHEVIVEGAHVYLAHCEAKGIEKQFRKMAKTWLHNRCWESELDTKSAQPMDGSPVRPCPSYLRRDFNDKPKETPEQKARKQLKLDVHDVMRKRGMEPLVMAVENADEYKRHFEDIAASLRHTITDLNREAEERMSK